MVADSGVGIVENALRLFKPDAVFDAVGLVLALVPREPQPISILSRYKGSVEPQARGGRRIMQRRGYRSGGRGGLQGERCGRPSYPEEAGLEGRGRPDGLRR